MKGINLDEVVIVAQAPQAITEEDTTVYTSSGFRTPEGAMLEDLVKQLPVEMVEQLKAYERKSDLARLTGIDDGEEEMVPRSGTSR